MRILFHGVPPQFGTGYGIQTRLFTAKLLAEGHDVAVSSVISPYPTMRDNNLLILSAGVRGTYGNDFIRAHYRFFNPEIVLTCTDTFVYEIHKFNELPWVAWQVIDCNPLLPQLEKPLKAAKINIAMSRFGQKVMSDAGFKSEYVPLAFNPKEYYPDGREKSRAMFEQAYKIEIKDRFVIVMNAANMSRPSRKNFAGAFKAFSNLLKRIPDALMYVHSDHTGQMCGGEDLKKVAMLYNLTPKNLIFAESYVYNTGMYGTDYLRQMYSMADVLLVTSFGEGFCVPVVEAMACNCPVLVAGATSLLELTPEVSHINAGMWKMTHVGTEQFEIYPDHATILLYQYYMERNSKQGIDWMAFAKPYEIDTVYQNWLKPLLNRISLGEFDLKTQKATKTELIEEDNLNEL